MHTVTINKQSVQIPASWDDCTPAQLLKLCLVYPFVQSPYDLLTQWLFLMAGLKPLRSGPIGRSHNTLHRFKLNGKPVILGEVILAELANHLKWVYDVAIDEDGKKPDVFSFNPKTAVNPLPIFGNLHGPSNGLTNCIYAEYAEAETHYFNYAASRNPDDLINLIATLWRPASYAIDKGIEEYKGDKRSPFNPFSTPQIAASVRLWPEHYKLAALFFYMGCRYNLSQIFPLVFTGGSSDDEAPAQAPNMFRFHLEVTHLLAQKSVNEREKVRLQLLYDVLDTLQKLREEAIYLEEKMKSHGTS